MTRAKIDDPATWPGSKVEIWPMADIRPYENNARKHPPAQIEMLAASMKARGVTNPIFVREDGRIIAGHGRFEAAELAGFTEIPVFVAYGWTDEECRAYTIADNALAEGSHWDEDLLRIEITDLRDDGVDLGLIGFDEKSLTAFLEPGTDDDPADDEARPKLAERFGLAPFSVLNARDGWWQDRKRAWLALGIRSELGRGEPSNG